MAALSIVRRIRRPVHRVWLLRHGVLLSMLLLRKRLQVVGRSLRPVARRSLSSGLLLSLLLSLLLGLLASSATTAASPLGWWGRLRLRLRLRLPRKVRHGHPSRRIGTRRSWSPLLRIAHAVLAVVSVRVGWAAGLGGGTAGRTGSWVTGLLEVWLTRSTLTHLPWETAVRWNVLRLRGRLAAGIARPLVVGITTRVTRMPVVASAHGTAGHATGKPILHVLLLVALVPLSWTRGHPLTHLVVRVHLIRGT